MPYTISEGGSTGISLAYSINAGFTWQESYSFIDDGDAVIWMSDRDLPGADVYECTLKLTPLCTDGSGVSGITSIFHLDNNTPPEVYLAPPREIEDGTYVLPYAVIDPEGDVIQLQAQYSTDGGATWNVAGLSGSTFEISRWFYGEPVTWYTRNDLGDGEQGLQG